MVESGWVQVFQRIPQEYFADISVISVTGNELVIQVLYRLEADFMIVRARVSGTMDNARVTVVPYSQIDFISFNKNMAEEEVQSVFGNGAFAACAQLAPSYRAAPPTNPHATPLPASIAFTPPPPTVHEPVAAEETAHVAEVPVANKSQLSKSILIARLRERLAEKKQ